MKPATCPYCAPGCVCVGIPPPDQTGDVRCGSEGFDRCDSTCCQSCRDGWSREAANEQERQRAVRGAWSGRPYWARIGLDKSTAHRFTSGEITGGFHGTACGLWAMVGGVPVDGARRCRRCEATPC